LDGSPQDFFGDLARNAFCFLHRKLVPGLKIPLDFDMRRLNDRRGFLAGLSQDALADLKRLALKSFFRQLAGFVSTRDRVFVFGAEPLALFEERRGLGFDAVRALFTRFEQI
jgi:hypothetical protein